jgi:hypothetical protein
VVVVTSQTNAFMLQKYAIGSRAGVRSSIQAPLDSVGAIVVSVACTNSICRNSRDHAINSIHESPQLH